MTMKKKKNPKKKRVNPLKNKRFPSLETWFSIFDILMEDKKNWLQRKEHHLQKCQICSNKQSGFCDAALYGYQEEEGESKNE